jgi:dTDP-4-dehydrorhamnose 3,5-epimerase
MIFHTTPLAGVVLVEPELMHDERGWFARMFAAEDFEAEGLEPAVVHCNVSFNARAGTLRGIHYQTHPHAECKLVRCTRGAIYDVALDLRPGSNTYLRWHAVELTAENGLALYIPDGVAHGFQTLRDEAEVFYQMSAPYVAASAHGVRWDDPAFAIAWPDADRIISERDRSYPAFAP